MLGTSFNKLQLCKLVVVVQDDLELLQGIFQRFSNVGKDQLNVDGDCQTLLLEAAEGRCLVWGLGTQHQLPKDFLPIKWFDELDEEYPEGLYPKAYEGDNKYDVEDFRDANGKSTVGFQPAYPDMFRT
jgi:hypothetical protein